MIAEYEYRIGACVQWISASGISARVIFAALRVSATSGISSASRISAISAAIGAIHLSVDASVNSSVDASLDRRIQVDIHQRVGAGFGKMPRTVITVRGKKQREEIDGEGRGN